MSTAALVAGGSAVIEAQIPGTDCGGVRNMAMQQETSAALALARFLRQNIA
jgi:hypothetical protein